MNLLVTAFSNLGQTQCDSKFFNPPTDFTKFSPEKFSKLTIANILR